MDFYLKCILQMKEQLIPVTSDQLEVMGKPQLCFPEYLCWSGVWMCIQINPGYNKGNYFLLTTRTWYWNPLYLGELMSGTRFEDINKALTLCNKTPSAHKERFWWVGEMIK